MVQEPSFFINFLLNYKILLILFFSTKTSCNDLSVQMAALSLTLEVTISRVNLVNFPEGVRPKFYFVDPPLYFMGLIFKIC